MIKKIKSLIPELFLIAGVCYYWSLTALTLNWLAILLLGALLFLIFTKNKIVGITFGALIILVNVYLIFALLSEFHEFPEFNKKAQELLLFGSLFIGLNIFFAGWLIMKYSKKSVNNPNEISEITNA